MTCYGFIFYNVIYEKPFCRLSKRLCWTQFWLETQELPGTLSTIGVHLGPAATMTSLEACWKRSPGSLPRPAKSEPLLNKSPEASHHICFTQWCQKKMKYELHSLMDKVCKHPGVMCAACTRVWGVQ